MSAYLVCLDSSILVHQFKRARSGSTLKGWDELKALVEAKEVTLLVPEVTHLELEKFVKRTEHELLDIAARIEALADNQNAAVREELGKALADPVKAWRTNTEAKWRDAAGDIFQFLNLRGETVEFTLEVSHKTRCRMMSFDFPKPRSKQPAIEDEGQPEQSKPGRKREQPEDRRDQDCFIIDSLIAHLKGKLEGKQLLFATQDQGFGPIEDGNGSLDQKFEKGVGILDKTFREGLPETQLFNNLEKLVEFVKAKRTVKPLTEEEQERIEEEEAKEQARQDYRLDAEAGRFEVNSGEHGITITIDPSDLEKLTQQQREQRKARLMSIFDPNRPMRQEVRQSAIFTAGGSGRTRTGGYLVAVPEPVEPEPPKTGEGTQPEPPGDKPQT